MDLPPSEPKPPQHVGIADPVHPLVRRVLAPNASPFTYTGTQSYIVGQGEVAVIDPGPASGPHVDALIAATAGERIAAILCTHSHRDHSPAARLLKDATGAPVIGCATIAGGGRGVALDGGFDPDYAPDRVLGDGERLAGEGWTLEAVATPGHTSNHLCFAFAEAGVLFSGDHVMGWSTSVVVPPDGEMGDYMASLEKLLGRSERLYLPGHGEPIERPGRTVRHMLGHRKQREGQIMRLLGNTPREVPDITATMYAGLDPRLAPAARQTVLAHLLDLARRGAVAREGDAWRLAA